jgi:tubulin-specific chaperone B
MPESTYAALPNTVMAWKKSQKLGRFDPDAPTPQSLATERLQHDSALVRTKGVAVGLRCRVGADDGRRGTVRFVGEIVGLGGEREAGCVWVGVELDEPVGRNDGSVKVEVVVERGEGGEKETERRTETRRVFECKDKFGVFARPEKVEVGEQWGLLDDLMDEDMEEI